MTGRHGDIEGTLATAARLECDAAAMVIEWGDLGSRLGLRSAVAGKCPRRRTSWRPAATGSPAARKIGRTFIEHARDSGRAHFGDSSFWLFRRVAGHPERTGIGTTVGCVSGFGQKGIAVVRSNGRRRVRDL